MTTEWHDHGFDDHTEGHVNCPKCDGWREVDCHCGGDLCVCENYGNRECPVCHGEGEVTQERYDQWWKRQREIHEAFQTGMKKGEGS